MSKTKRFKQFDEAARNVIEITENGFNITRQKVAEFLQCSESAISQEVKRNSRFGKYNARKAQEEANDRKPKRKKRPVLDDPEIGRYIEKKLKLGWIPDEIAVKSKEDLPGSKQVSKGSIYNYIYAQVNDEKKLWKLLRLKRSRPKKRSYHIGKLKRGEIPGRVSIHERPKIIEERLRIGDWEGDTVIGANHQGVIATFVDRTARYTLIGKMEDKSMTEMHRVATEQFKTIPKRKRHSMTTDNGKEFASHLAITKELEMPIFFADAYSSWQRGTNENMNKQIRRFLPKGTDLRGVTQKELDEIAHKLNNRPRKCLGYRTPAEVFNSA